MRRVLIHSAQPYDGAPSERCWAVFAEGVVVAEGRGEPPELFLSPDVAIIDAAGFVLAPGFIDLHCHGGGGATYAEGVEEIVTAQAVHRAHGTTRTLLSMSTAPMDTLAASLRMAREAVAADPSLLGVHLEGPFLSHDHRGAHVPQLLAEPTRDRMDRLREAAGSALRVVTLAPELPGGMARLRELVDEGITVAVGHTSATFETAHAAFAAGARLLTHAFNGMPGLHHREPGPVAAALEAPDVVLELINDGVHVHPAVAGALLHLAPDRVALVTDAMAATGFGDGIYRTPSRTVVVTDGVAMLEDGSSIAGSTLTLDQALRRAVTVLGTPLADAVHAVSRTPAHVLGLDDRFGSLTAGYVADAVLLDRRLAVRRVWVGGVEVSTNPTAITCQHRN